MEIAGCVALVTGAGRGLGKAYVDALLELGARKVYCGMRHPSPQQNSSAVSILLDVTDPSDIAAAAATCGDVTLVINNAGIMTNSTILDQSASDNLRQEMEVNVYGLLAMMQAFAPVLANNGGGALINVLSLVAVLASPFTATYSATKHAAHALTDCVRKQLRGQGTLVSGVYCGFMDTEMVSSVTAAKTPPAVIARRTLEEIRVGNECILADRRTEITWRDLFLNRSAIHERVQRAWDEAHRASVRS